MDGLIFIIIAIVFVALDGRAPAQNEEVNNEPEYESVETRVTKVNENYYDDPNAFSKIINALGYPKE